MPYPTPRLVLLAVLLSSFVFAVDVSAQQSSPKDDRGLIENDSLQVLDASKKIEEVFGPVPAIASTPYLGLAVLTGAALLSDQPALAHSKWGIVRELRRNALINHVKGYASWWLFGLLVVLAALTGLANSGKLEGSLGKLARGAENVTTGLAYAVVAISTLTSISAAHVSTGVHPRIAYAGAFPAFESTALTLIMTALVSLVAMMVVRFAFDILIWLIPVPFIDLMFETSKAIFSLAFLVIYFVSPVAAAIVGGMLLVPCLMLLPWAIRLLRFAYRIVFCPILACVLPALKPSLIEPAIAETVSGKSLTLACHASVLKARGLKKRQAIALLQLGGQTALQPLRKKKRRRTLCEPPEQVLLGRTMAWIELRVLNAEGKILDRIALPRSLISEFDTIRVLLGARDAGDFGTLKVIRAVGNAARHGVDSVTHVVQNRTTRE